ncbi:uncharacterized protein [Nicotiana tomentosiformis]|uniref:uncharacterized protein n=1 Tax=Nicotiana tomentosiformis TaxID=4098 RepID=UPI00388C9650
MAKDTGSEISFHATTNVARRVEMVLVQGTGQGSDKRPCHSGGFSGASSGGCGTVSVCSRDVSVLFDPGSTYSYVSSYFACYLVMPRDSLSAHVYVSTPVGYAIIVDHIYRSCVVTIGSHETRVDLLLLDMVDFDVILGMDWLSPYHAILDYHAKTVP